jgi:hypothetical protein
LQGFLSSVQPVSEVVEKGFQDRVSENWIGAYQSKQPASNYASEGENMQSTVLPWPQLLVLPVVFRLTLAQAGSRPAQDEQRNQAIDHRMAEVNKHGAEAMGFDQEKTAHHFRLLRGGGVIEVQANDPRDAATVELIRLHLRQQAKSFDQGDFAAPRRTHGRVPPGVATIKRLSREITYQFRESERGGELWITSANPRAVGAVHKFLRFQIGDHRTGDPTEVR